MLTPLTYEGLLTMLLALIAYRLQAGRETINLKTTEKKTAAPKEETVASV
jgi:hypothetical protein